MKTKPCECPSCKEIALREISTIHDDLRHETGTEYECFECNHYEVHWRRNVPALRVVA